VKSRSSRTAWTVDPSGLEDPHQAQCIHCYWHRWFWEEPVTDDSLNGFRELCCICFSSCLIVIPLLAILLGLVETVNNISCLVYIWKARPFMSHSAQPEQLALSGSGSFLLPGACCLVSNLGAGRPCPPPPGTDAVGAIATGC